MSDRGVRRTAPVTPGLLKMHGKNLSFQLLQRLQETLAVHYKLLSAISNHTYDIQHYALFPDAK